MNPLKIHQADSSVSTSRSVTILGSTGSVGCNTVELIEKNLEQFTIEALTANRKRIEEEGAPFLRFTRTMFPGLYR